MGHKLGSTFYVSDIRQVKRVTSKTKKFVNANNTSYTGAAVAA